MKHRLTYLVLALLFLFSVPAAAHPEVTVEVDGEALAFDVPPTFRPAPTICDYCNSLKSTVPVHSTFGSFS